MTYADRLTFEINTMLDALAEKGAEWRASAIAHAICQSHVDGVSEGEGADFWRHCGYTECRRQVTSCINRRAGDRVAQDVDAGQMTLPGFKHLHRYYVVQRDGTDVGIPVIDMTDIEIAGKESQYRAMGSTCFEHANELRRFRDSRGIAEAAS